MTAHLGVSLTATRSTRDAPGAFTARLPHPLYVGRPRIVEGDLSSGRTRESAIHFGLVWSATRAGVVLRLSGGPSYFLLEADLAERVAYEHEYPYDVVRVTSVTSSPVRGDAVGGHAGLTMERRIAGRVAIGGGARWSQATIALARTDDGTERAARLRAGGITASGSIRLYF